MGAGVDGEEARNPVATGPGEGGGGANGVRLGVERGWLQANGEWFDWFDHGEGGAGKENALGVEWDWGESIAGEGDWSSVGVAGSTEGPGWTSASSAIAEASWCCGSLM